MPPDASKTAAAVMTDAADLPVLERAPESSWTCSRTFPARPDQVGEVRAFLGRVLVGWPKIEDAVLICCELVTNAVLHSASARPGGHFTVRAKVREDDYLWIEVQDQGGRGLEIVAALADYWDIRGDDTARVVCARLDWPVSARDGA